MMDWNWIVNIKKKVKRDMELVGYDFEVVVVFKEYCDKKDMLFIYKINDCRGNLEILLFVFKMSEIKVKIVWNMDRGGDYFLYEEFCFFDGKWK